MGDQEYKQNHKKKGLCTQCSRKAVPGKTRCRWHLYTGQLAARKYYGLNRDKHIQRVRAKRARYIKEGRCYMCGAPLHKEDNKLCINCSIKAFKPRDYGDFCYEAN